MGPHIKRLCLGVLVRSKLRTRWVYFLLLLLFYLVFFQLNSRHSPRLPALDLPVTNMALAREKVTKDRRSTTAGKAGVKLIADDIFHKGDNRYSISSTNTDNRESRKFRIARSGRGGFLFVFRYYEQLGRATDNLIHLTSLARYNDRQVVAPFVNNSRMSGLRGGVSGRGNKRQDGFRFGTLDEYLDVSQVNARLLSSGYGTLVDFQLFKDRCDGELDLLVHFLYATVARSSPMDDLMSWYKLNSAEVKEIYGRTQRNGGWGDCLFLKKSKAAQLLNFKVRRYACVDAEMVTSAYDLEEKIFNRAKCVGIVQWKGMGEGRTHFPLFHSITQRVKPSDLNFNPELVKLAEKFIHEKLGDSFIAIHVRSERHLVFKGVNITLRCIHKLGRRVRESQAFHNIPRLFLAYDLAEHGSDTLVGFTRSSDRSRLSRALRKYLNSPITFSPQKVGVYDTGAAAIIEMNVLSMATRLFTLGGGNFQEWVVDLFRLRNKGRETRLHRMCEIS